MAEESSVSQWLDGVRAGDAAAIERLRSIAVRKLEGYGARRSRRSLGHRRGPSNANFGLSARSGRRRWRDESTGDASRSAGAGRPAANRCCLRPIRGGLAYGQRPDLAEFLADVPASVRAQLFRDLLSLDLEYRRRLGEQPDARSYCERFPEFRGAGGHGFRVAFVEFDQDTRRSQQRVRLFDHRPIRKSGNRRRQSSSDFS